MPGAHAQNDDGRLGIAVVFLLTRQCNLRCLYCNVDAGPARSPRLDPRLFESWISSIARLGRVDIGIQLHGGEPLLADPPVEMYAAIARNAAAATGDSSVGAVTIITNGLLLDQRRASSLSQAGINVGLSLDGSEGIHDRFRRTASGRGSHDRAMLALTTLRKLGTEPGVIAVVSNAADVLEASSFFFRHEVTRFRINPMRPEGRGGALLGRSAVHEMRAMAEQHAVLARRLAAHNEAEPARPVYEENVHLIMSRIAQQMEPTQQAPSWTLLIDELGDLWSHPGALGFEALRLTSDEDPTPSLVARALGVSSIAEPGVGRQAQVLRARRALFNPCEGCSDPVWCDRFRPVVRREEGEPMDLECVWRAELTEHLESWWRQDPQSAQHVLRQPRPRHTSLDARLDRSTGDGFRALTTRRSPPLVKAIVDDLVPNADGELVIRNLAHWVLELKQAAPVESQRASVDLVRLAIECSKWESSVAVGRHLAQLARVGLLSGR